jgi:hypothetical protein
MIDPVRVKRDYPAGRPPDRSCRTRTADPDERSIAVIADFRRRQRDGAAPSSGILTMNDRVGTTDVALSSSSFERPDQRTRKVPAVSIVDG